MTTPGAEIIDPATVLAAFTEITRGDGGEVVDGCIELETLHRHVVIAWPGAEGWWEARLEVRGSVGDFIGPRGSWLTLPLKQGPVWYADSGTTVDEIVEWLREVTNSQADGAEVPT